MAYQVVRGKVVRVIKGRQLSVTQQMKIRNFNRDLDKELHPDPKLKGKLNGNCNVTACQKPGATWWNTSTRAYYCATCASEINYWSRHDDKVAICFKSTITGRLDTEKEPEYHNIRARDENE